MDPKAYARLPLRSLKAGALLAGLLLAVPALAAPAVADREARATFERDRAACATSTAGQDRAACLREAAAALKESRRNGFTDDSASHERNRLARCERQPEADRPDCLRRMNGEGSVSGSVEGGAILRELVVPDLRAR